MNSESQDGEVSMSFISMEDVCLEMDCSRASVYRWMNRTVNPFPKPYKMGEGVSAKLRFKRDEINSWLKKTKK